jgi:hypothetical protein
MTAPGTLVAERLVDKLSTVDIDVARLTARFGGHEVSGGSIAQLRRRLAQALYETLHLGREEPLGQRPRDLRDHDFEARLRSAVPHAHTLTEASVVDRNTVELSGVRVRLPLSDNDIRTAGQHVLVKVDCARPRLSPGFLLVDGSAGNGLHGGRVLRVYLHVADTDHAPDLWSAVLERLELLAVPYRAKITSVRTQLPRCDAMVVYLGPDAWRAADAIPAAVTGLPGLRPQTSWYANRLAPGVAAAWEPADRRPGFRALSFGEHRSLTIATALLDHAENPATALEPILAAAFTAANTDPGNIFQNITSGRENS